MGEWEAEFHQYGRFSLNIQLAVFNRLVMGVYCEPGNEVLANPILELG